MEYGVTLNAYVDILAEKFQKGKITEARFVALTNTLILWERNAAMKGVK